MLVGPPREKKLRQDCRPDFRPQYLRTSSGSLAMFTTIVLNERPLARHGGALPGAALGLCVRRDRAAHIMQ
jgi:hypothetical protein